MSLLSGNLLSPVSFKIGQMNEVLLSEESRIGETEAEISLAENQLYISTADRLLGRYESMLNLSVGIGSIDERRSKIIAKLNARLPATLANMERIVTILTAMPCTIEERYSQYAFVIKFSTDKPNIADIMRAVKSQIDEMKPAHLTYFMIYLLKSETATIYTGARHTIATRIKVLPYLPGDIVTTGNILPTSFVKYGATIKINPRIGD